MTTQAKTRRAEGAAEAAVLISGAGPTGLLLAHLLAREGIAFRIVDEDATRAKESRALAIQPRSMELLRSLGLVDPFLQRGMKAEGITIVARGKRTANINFSDIGRKDTPYPYIFFLSQSVTEEILEEKLWSKCRKKVDRQTRLVRFEETAHVVRSTLSHPDGTTEVLETRYLVGCDGARSQVRKSSGLGFSGGTYEAEFMLADAKVNWDLPIDRLIFLIGDQYSALLMPLKGAEVSRIVTIGENKARTNGAREDLTTKIPATIEEIQASLREASSRQVTLTQPQWVTRYRVHHRCVEKMRVGRILLAGDAAHIHSPAGGQGMNTGFQDAANLGWKLAQVIRGEAPDELLDTYHSERWPVAQKLLRFTDRLFGFAASQSPILKRIRPLIIPTLGKILFSTWRFRRYMFGFVSQLNIRYHPSPVVVESVRGDSRNKKVHAGCRAPDVSLDNGKTLHNLMGGYQFHVVVMSRKPIPELERGAFGTRWRERNLLGSANAEIHWIDSGTNKPVLDAYEVGDTLISLVRPDGYIGYQADQLAV